MKQVILAFGLAALLSGCAVSGGVQTVGFNSEGLEPIPGSITYGGQPRTRLTKSPIGSMVPHTFNNQFGQRVDETYIIQPDRSLKIVDRRIYRGVFGDL